MAIKMAIRRAMGIVNSMNEGRRKMISLATMKMLIPLLTIKSMIWRILPMSNVKVSMNKMMMKGKAISLKI
jgi:hypothetical protein